MIGAILLSISIFSIVRAYNSFESNIDSDKLMKNSDIDKSYLGAIYYSMLSILSII
jgi:hypothetical protein